jgi:mannose-6-phosphate isomerase-like protein (cupin superfamily)
MANMNERAGFDLIDTYIHLLDGGSAESIAVDDEFWAQIGNREALHEGRLMGAFRVTEDPSHWEVHPEGDEILYLISGSMDVILQQQGREHIVPLRDRGVCIVPRGVWHRQVVHSPSEFAFIAPGKGTQTRTV